MTYTSDFLDFYVLETIRHFCSTSKELEFSHANEKLLRDVKNELENVTHNLYMALHDYIFLASFGEARHAFNTIGYRLNCLEKDYSRSYAYHLAKDYSPQKNYPVLSELFSCDGWNDSVGGKMWKHIADALGLIYENNIPKGAFVDYCADLRHNGGLMFNKPIVFNNDMDTDVMMFVLTRKRDAPNFALEVCNGQEHGKSAYHETFLHSKTATLLNRYMMIHYNRQTYVSGTKPNDGYDPIDFGIQYVEIVENDHIVICDNCGTAISDGEANSDEGKTYCNNCYSDMEHEEHFCDRCGKKRTSTNQYILNEMSMCHACYDVVKSQMSAGINEIYSAADNINELSNSIKNAMLGTEDISDVLKHLVKVDGDNPSP